MRFFSAYFQLTTSQETLAVAFLFEKNRYVYNMIRNLLFCFQLTDALCHAAHRTEGTPCTGFIQHHHDKTNEGGGQHHTIKPKAEFRDPGCCRACGICPVPWHTERPEQGDGFLQAVCPCRHQISLEQHIPEHDHEKGQKTITKPFGIQKVRSRLIPRYFRAQFLKQLSSAAKIVAEGLVSAKNGQHQRQQEFDHPQPCKEDIEKPQTEINDLPDPEVIIPMRFLSHTSASFSSIQPAGQVLAQMPQPMHFSASTTA